MPSTLLLIIISIPTTIILYYNFILFIKYLTTEPIHHHYTNNVRGFNFENTDITISVYKRSNQLLINGHIYSSSSINAIYQYLINHNIFYWFKLPSKHSYHTIYYNFWTGTIYIGCTAIPKKYFLIIHKFINEKV